MKISAKKLYTKVFGDSFGLEGKNPKKRRSKVRKGWSKILRKKLDKILLDNI